MIQMTLCIVIWGIIGFLKFYEWRNNKIPSWDDWWGAYIGLMLLLILATVCRVWV